MMQSNKSEHSYRRQYSERSLRQRDDYDYRWEERRDSHRDVPHDSYKKYAGNGHNSTERTSRSREYSDSPNGPYGKDSLNRDWNRKSSARRPRFSPDWGTFEKKRQRFEEDDKDDCRYRCELENKTNRLSPDSFSSSHVTKDLKHKHLQEEDLKYRKMPQDSRHRHRHEQVSYRQQHDSGRQSSSFYKDGDGHERNRECSPERIGPRDRSTKSYAIPRERNDSPSADHEDYRQNRAWLQLNGSCGQSSESDVSNQNNAVPEQKSAMGFQRFLDVLNKGVNVDTLTKIVTQTSTEAGNRPPFMDRDRPWSPTYADRQQGEHQNTNNWCESDGSKRLASPQRRHRSFSPKGGPQGDENSLQRCDGGPLGSNGRSASPSVVEKTTLSPEDEHKHRQMQDVLQAIGINLGSEELGQMSNRIQERLYGKKESGCHHIGSRERETKRAYSPKKQSRSSSSSSSSRSSFSPLNREYYNIKDSQGAVTTAHGAQVHDTVEYGQDSSCSTLQIEKCETYSQESAAACQSIPQNSPYILTKPSPTMPAYSPVNSSPLPYPAPPPSLPHNLPPTPPHLGPRLFLPCLPPFFPYPRVPPANVFPAILPQHISNPRLFNLPGVNPVQPLNTTQKSKPVSRPRCLQVIETKQPG